MAKPTTKKVVAKVPVKAATAVSTGSNVDVDMLLEQYAGAGVSTDAADNTIPFIYLLQSLSPVTLKQKPEYIKGAEAGMIWPRGERVVWDGEDEGINVVPCHFAKCWVEWLPNRGGFVARHNDKPKEAELKVNPNDKKDRRWVMPNGNSVSESKEWAVLVLDKQDNPLPYVIAMSGSNLKASNDWMALINRKMTKKGNPAGLFANIYNLKTVPRSNDKGDWYMWFAEDVRPLDDGDVHILQEAIRIHKAFKGGDLKVAEADYSGNLASEEEEDTDSSLV